jgi:hypothetical protein
LDVHSFPTRRSSDLPRGLGLGSLYNPDLPELAWDIPRHSVLVNPNRFFGSQALLIARDLAQYFSTHWFDNPLIADLKMGALVARYGQPVLCHHPSLVQHVGYHSQWGSGFHQATDFNANWRADRPADSLLVELVTADAPSSP